MIATAGVHPIFLLMAVIGIVTGLYTLYVSIPGLMPILFAVSVVGLLARLLQLARESQRQKHADAVISFEALRQKDIARFAGWLKENVRGHDAAVDRVVAKLQQGLDLAAPHRTLGAFLLVGPTGTGKTFLGELVAQALYPDSEPVILRMNQYKDHQDVFTLIGPPPGYQGYEIGGALTRPVLENPYRVVILDEFEKSHPDVRHCFYDILDRAECQEKSSGKTVHYGAAAFFATCNSGVEPLRAIWSESEDPIIRTGRAREVLAREGFERPLLARFDEIVLMDQLPSFQIAEVACLQIAKYWRQYGIEVDYTSPEVLVEAIRRNVEFQDYGVRQLAHLIQELTNPAIEAARREGAARVRLDLDHMTGKLTVSR
jgi:ATP-dependent Clp protease ATP-binding subunit ClpA